MKTRVIGILLSLSLSLALAADDQHKHHATQGELGKVKFATSCTRQVRPQFERAVAMLHSFWYDQAEAAFNQIAAKDPECAMAYWGIAMSLHHPLWSPASAAEVERGAVAIAKAQTAKKTSARERAFISALAAVYDPANKSLGARNKAFSTAMEKVYRAYPLDDEAAIFYALALRSTASPTDKSYAVQREVGKILDPLYRKQPHHPGLAHYVIHNYDYPELAQHGLQAARRYAQIAPAAPHALHMPSHIFVRLGLWEDAIQSNLAAANAGRADFQKTGSKGALAEQLHAMDYLAYGYLQRGETAKAVAVWDELKRTPEADWSYFSAYHSALAIPARVTVEMRRWADAEALPEPTYSGGSYWTQVASGITYWARTVGAARNGNLGKAREGVTHLARLQQQLAKAGQADGADTLKILQLSARGWIAYAEKESAEALRLLRESADLEDRTDKHPVTPGAVLPAREQLADMLLELNRPGEALVEYETSLKTAPNRFNSLRGAVRAAAASGQSQQVAAYAAKLKAVAPAFNPR